jgi:hypothetical protein
VINKSTSKVLTDSNNLTRLQDGNSTQQLQNGGSGLALSQNGGHHLSSTQLSEDGAPSFRSRLDFTVQPSSGHFRARSR